LNKNLKKKKKKKKFNKKKKKKKKKIKKKKKKKKKKKTNFIKSGETKIPVINFSSSFCTFYINIWI